LLENRYSIRIAVRGSATQYLFNKDDYITNKL